MVTKKDGEVDGLYLIFIGVSIFVLSGIALQTVSSDRQWDFKSLYWPSHCLVNHCDPFNESAVIASSKIVNEPTITRLPYPPTVFVLLALMGLLPWWLASILWSFITLGSMIAASFFLWNVGKSYSPLLSGVLIAFIMANSEVIAMLTNAAGITVALCIFSCWSFIKGRYAWAGVFCLALSLLIKPQDTGFIWLFFLLVGGSFRRRALQTLAVATLLSIPILAYMWSVYPHWLQEWHSNLASFAVKGGMTDPGPTSIGSHGLGAFVNLQAALSELWDNPHFYNLTTYAMMAPLFAVWGALILKSRQNPRSVFVGLAATSSLSLLPVYHHVYDAKILLLAIPACAALWAEGKRFAPAITILAVVFTSDMSLVVFRVVLQELHANVLEPVAPPVILLVMGMSYLRILANDGNITVPRSLTFQPSSELY